MTNTDLPIALPINKEYKVVEFLAGSSRSGDSSEALAEINKDGNWTLESTNTGVSYDDPIVIMVFSRSSLGFADSL